MRHPPRYSPLPAQPRHFRSDTGKNVWGGFEAEHPAQFGGKNSNDSWNTVAGSFVRR